VTDVRLASLVVVAVAACAGTRGMAGPERPGWANDSACWEHARPFSSEHERRHAYDLCLANAEAVARGREADRAVAEMRAEDAGRTREATERARDRADQPTPADLAGEVEASERVGQQLYVLDMAAALASDAALAHFKDRAPRIGGWLAIRAVDDRGEPAPAFLVFFFGLDAPLRLLVRVRVPMISGVTPTVEELTPPAPPPPQLETLIRARQLALKQSTVRPDRRWNPVVLPASLVGQRGWLVYVLQASAEREMVMGVHRRMLISEDAQRVVHDQPMSRSDLRIPVDPDGTKIAGAWTTHGMSDAPTEIHVMLGRQHKQPIYVATRRGAWRVESGRIHYLGPLPETPPAP